MAGHSWRCFYCDEVFFDEDAAARHFGPRQSVGERKPACKIDVDHVRKLENEHENAMVRLTASAWVKGTDGDRLELEAAVSRLFPGRKIEQRPQSSEDWRAIIDGFELWAPVGADGYNVAADRLANLIAFHIAAAAPKTS